MFLFAFSIQKAIYISLINIQGHLKDNVFSEVILCNFSQINEKNK
jgi:hypothetical protein